MNSSGKQKQKNGVLSRRDLLKIGGGLSLASLFPLTTHTALQEFEIIDYDPLKSYPYRGWEGLYRDQFTRPGGTFDSFRQLYRFVFLGRSMSGTES